MGEDRQGNRLPDRSAGGAKGLDEDYSAARQATMHTRRA